jgi:hypothetical protein
MGEDKSEGERKRRTPQPNLLPQGAKEKYRRQKSKGKIIPQRTRQDRLFSQLSHPNYCPLVSIASAVKNQPQMDTDERKIKIQKSKGKSMNYKKYHRDTERRKSKSQK